MLWFKPKPRNDDELERAKRELIEAQKRNEEARVERRDFLKDFLEGDRAGD